MIDVEEKGISIKRQCELLDLPKFSYYYATRGDNSDNEKFMRLLDEPFTRDTLLWCS